MHSSRTWDIFMRGAKADNDMLVLSCFINRRIIQRPRVPSKGLVAAAGVCPQEVLEMRHIGKFT
jgi:hypothetical protein